MEDAYIDKEQEQIRKIVSFQKVAAAMRRLKEEGRVEEIPGEKAKDKKTYKAL